MVTRWLFAWRHCQCALFGIDDVLLGTIGGSLISGLFGSEGQESANDTNIALARENREFQERMSSTAYQRAVSDMKDAGLNPMLAYSQGGASAPVGSMPQVQNAAAAGVASAAQGANMFQAVQSIMQSKAQTELIEAEAAKVRTETMERESNAAEQMARIAELRERAKKQGLESLTEAERAMLVRAQTEDTSQSAYSRLIANERDKDSFSADVERRKAISLQEQFGVAGAKAASDFYKSELGHDSPWLKWMLDFIKVLSGAGNLAGMKR